MCVFYCKSFCHLYLFLYHFHQLFLQLCHILTGNCGLLNLLSIALSVSLLDDEHFNSSAILKKKKGQEKKARGMSSYL